MATTLYFLLKKDQFYYYKIKKNYNFNPKNIG